MLVIRAAQMEILAEPMLRDFIDGLAVRLARKLPDRCRALGGEALKALIERSIKKGRRYGIVTEKDVAILAELMLELPADFEKTPEFAWTRPVLEQRGAESDGRMEVLYFRITGQTVES